MRTTVNIDDHVLPRAKVAAEEQGMTLGELITASLVERLARQQGADLAAEVRLPTVDCTWAAPVDPTSNRVVYEYLDASDAQAASA